MKGPRKTVDRVRIRRHRGGPGERARDVVAVEEPLELRLAWQDPAGARKRSVAVTMRTPGDDFELAAGFLFSEGLLPGRSALSELVYCADDGPQRFNIVEARLRPGVAVDESLLDRNFYTTSSCGVCGRASLDAVEARGCSVLPAGFRLPAALVPELPERLLEGQRTFRRTGGLHAAGLFDAEGVRRSVREDVGRHNAVDKVVGEALLDGRLPLSDRVLVVSGRASFELVQKAVAAGVPVLVAVGAPSSLAVDLAVRFGLTLAGFAREGRFNVYAGEERVIVG